jgi:hypothetical protein
MSCIFGQTYVGLTDDPIRRRIEHGDPPDWRVEHWFWQEQDARAWRQLEAQRPAHCGGPDRGGWRFGYKYTVTGDSRE